MKKHLLKSLLALALVLITGNAWGEDKYVKVTDTSDLTDGTYLIVNETSKRAFNGLDAASDYVEVAISNNAIADPNGAAIVEIAAMTGGYSIKITNGDKAGKYIYGKSGSNSIQFGDDAVANEITLDGGAATILSNSTSFRYNSASGNDRFRYYKTTTTGASYIVPALYKKQQFTPSKELVSVAVSGTPTKTEYTEGDEFAPAGLVVTGTYDDASTDDTMASQATWSCTPTTLTAETTSVTVTATVNGITSEAYVVNGITVEPFVQTYANTYTSNVELTTEGGTSASDAKVVIDETEYDAIKAGTGKAQGACVVTIPAGTKTLHFHAAGWNGESVTLDVNGTEYTLTSDAGVSNNSPFTLANDPETKDYFTFTPNGATTVTFTATSGNRFVLFGVNAEACKSHNVTIASSGKSTLFLDYAVTVPEDVKAYYATGYDATNDVVTMTEVEGTIAANQGVMLMGTAGETYTFVETADLTAPETNYFGGDVDEMNMDGKTGEDGYYILKGGQFTPISGGNLPAYKAYLYLEARPYTGQSSTIGFRFGDATQIENVNAVEAGKYFDLMGREVLNPAGGIYILNGKKVLVK